MKLLIARLDRLGDTLLSTPAFQEAGRRAAALGGTADVAVPIIVAPLLKGIPHVARVISPDQQMSFWGLVRQLKRERYDAVILLNPNLRLSLAAWSARIPKRIGVLTRWWTMLLYTQPVRQSRSQVARHEAEYNLELVSVWSKSHEGPTAHVPPNTWACVNDAARERARLWVKTHVLERAPSRGLIAIHPGMGGSALNWSWDQYAELGLELAREGWSVVYTGGAADAVALSQVRQRVTRAPSGITFYDALVSQSLEDLGALFLLADLVVAPSTGPLHLAVALGRPVVGIYSPVRVQSARRWGPWHTRGTEGQEGASPTARVALSPQVSCPAVFKCIGSACPHYFCMETVTPLQVIEQVRKINHESHS